MPASARPQVRVNSLCNQAASACFAGRWARLPGGLRRPHPLGPERFPYHTAEFRGVEALRGHSCTVTLAHALRPHGLAICLHGQYGSAFSYRRVIPRLLEEGFDVAAVDLVGFGWSSKPLDDSFHTFPRHRAILAGLLRALGAEDALVIAWGFAAGLAMSLPQAVPGAVGELLLYNARIDFPLPAANASTHIFRAFGRLQEPDPAKAMAKLCPHLLPEELAVYEAPFLDSLAKAGLRRGEGLLPLRESDAGGRAFKDALMYLRDGWTGRAVLAAGCADPISGPAATAELRRWLPRCGPVVELQGVSAAPFEFGPWVLEQPLSRLQRLRDLSA